MFKQVIFFSLLVLSTNLFANQFEYGTYQFKGVNGPDAPGIQMLIEILESTPTKLRLEMIVAPVGQNVTGIKDIRELSKVGEGQWAYSLGASFGKVEQVTVVSGSKEVTAYKVVIKQPDGNTLVLKNEKDQMGSVTNGHIYSPAKVLLLKMSGRTKKITEAEYRRIQATLKVN